MMKKFFVAATVAMTMALGMSATADAHSNRGNASIGIFFGVPHFGSRIDDNYRFRTGYGWYRFGDDDGRYYRDRLTCREARRAVRNSGYRNVSRVECNGTTYTFNATRRGNDYTVFVNSRTGRISRR